MALGSGAFLMKILTMIYHKEKKSVCFKTPREDEITKLNKELKIFLWQTVKMKRYDKKQVKQWAKNVREEKT